MLLQMVIGPSMIRNGTANSAAISAYVMEKEVLRLAWRLNRWIRPKDVIDHLDVDFRTARKWLRSLVEKGCLSLSLEGRTFVITI
ncbi:MAG: hypothetical protein K0Q73_7425 [Paenibacillus sp.]|jgi:predicted transcriptional regulator|nr:hypothetical protein [Paenibacillus sp.]